MHHGLNAQRNQLPTSSTRNRGRQLRQVRFLRASDISLRTPEQLGQVLERSSLDLVHSGRACLVQLPCLFLRFSFHLVKLQGNDKVQANKANFYD